MSRTAALLAALLLAGVAPPSGPARALAVRGAVFTTTNAAAEENRVVAFERRGDGSLRPAGAFATGGLGAGPAPTSAAFGAPIPLAADGLGSQGSLILSPDRRFLFAANAGGDSVACFRVNGGLPDGPGTLRGLRVAPDGGLRLLPDRGAGAGVVATLAQDDPARWTGEPGAVFGNHGVDVAAVEDGGRAVLYAAEPRLGRLGAWEIGSDGALRPVGTFAGGLPERVDPFAGTNPGIGAFRERCFLQAGPRSPECAAGSVQGLAGF